MERRLIMKEEKVTINILNWLESNDWKIICYDFPQSGTGVLLHPNSEENRNEKNKGGIIPDIIAVKNNCALFFENKDRFYEPDFNKLFLLRTKQNYSNSLAKLLKGYNVKVIYYGIAISDVKKEIIKSKLHLEKIQFLISTTEEKNIIIHYDAEGIFSSK